MLGNEKGFCVRDVALPRLEWRWATLDVPKLSPARFRLSRPMPIEQGMAKVTSKHSGR